MLAGTRVWITGASSGIGRALAQAALTAGARVAASGRNAEALQTLPAAVVARPSDAPAAERFLPLPHDVQDPAAAQDAARQIQQKWGGLDWAIANAGDCRYLTFPDWDDQAVRDMMEINFFGALNTARAALPYLAAQDAAAANRRGLFAATSSAAVFAPLPRGCAYGASKAALAYFIRSLRGHYPSVDFSVIYPGFVQTPLTDKNDFAMPALMPAERAAGLILAGLRRRRAVIRFPARLIAALRLINLLPARWQQRVLAKMAQAGDGAACEKN